LKKIKENKMKRALVTGGSGFVGRHLITSLIKKKYKVVNLGRKKLTFPNCQNIALNEIDNYEEIKSVIFDHQPRYIFHLAASLSDDLMQSMKVNLFYLKHILDSITELGYANLTKIIVIGSAAEYGYVREENLPISELQPTFPYSNYGISKLAQTNYAISWAKKNTGSFLVVLRPFTISGYGVSEKLALGNFIKQIKNYDNGMSIKTGNLKNSRDYIDIKDFVQIIFDILENPNANNEIINVCSGKSVTLEFILNYLIKKSSKELFVESDPKLFRTVDMKDHYGDNSKLLSLINGYVFTPITESLDIILREDE